MPSFKYNISVNGRALSGGVKHGARARDVVEAAGLDAARIVSGFTGRRTEAKDAQTISVTVTLCPKSMHVSKVLNAHPLTRAEITVLQTCRLDSPMLWRKIIIAFWNGGRAPLDLNAREQATLLKLRDRLLESPDDNGAATLWLEDMTLPE